MLFSKPETTEEQENVDFKTIWYDEVASLNDVDNRNDVENGRSCESRLTVIQNMDMGIVTAFDEKALDYE